MHTRCLEDALIESVGTIWSLKRAKSVLFLSLRHPRSQEYLEPCFSLIFRFTDAHSCILMKLLIILLTTLQYAMLSLI